MPIIAKDEGTTYPLPPAGQYLAVCCDVVDLGMVASTFDGETKKQHKITVVFQLAENDPDSDEPYRVSQRFTLSLNEKANLRKFLESWRGGPYTEERIKEGVDVELMVGANALLQVVHATRGDRTYANINSIMKALKGMAKLTPRLYERVKDRKQDGNGSSKPNGTPSTALQPGRVADALQRREVTQHERIAVTQGVPLEDDDIPVDAYDDGDDGSDSTLPF